MTLPSRVSRARRRAKSQCLYCTQTATAGILCARHAEANRAARRAWRQAQTNNEEGVMPTPRKGDNTMAKYLIERHGANAANQLHTQVEILGIVEAKSIAEAKDKAEEELGTVYNNQFLRVFPASSVSLGKWNHAVELDAINRGFRHTITTP